MVAQVFGRDAKESSCSRRSCDVNQWLCDFLKAGAGSLRLNGVAPPYPLGKLGILTMTHYLPSLPQT